MDHTDAGLSRTRVAAAACGEDDAPPSWPPVLGWRRFGVLTGVGHPAAPPRSFGTWLACAEDSPARDPKLTSEPWLREAPLRGSPWPEAAAVASVATGTPSLKKKPRKSEELMRPREDTSVVSPHFKPPFFEAWLERAM